MYFEITQFYMFKIYFGTYKKVYKIALTFFCLSIIVDKVPINRQNYNYLT